MPKFLRLGVELGRRRAAGGAVLPNALRAAQKSPAGGCTGSAPAGRKTEMRDQAGRGLQGKVTLCVVEADALDDLLQSLLVIGILAILDPLADDVAQDAAEVVVAGVAQEAAAVGQHTDEVAQQAQAGQTGHLLFHADLVVVEPPGGTVLDLARNLAVLEAAQNGADLGVIAGVQAVDDGLGALVGVVQSAQQACDLAAAGGRVDHVEAGVGAQQAVHLAVDAAQAVVVDLHGNVQAVILLAQVDQDVGLILLNLFRSQSLAGHGLLVDGVDLFLGGLTIRHVVQAVVGSAAAHLDEELNALGQSIADAVDAGQLLLADDLSQLAHVLDEAGFLDVEGLVGAEGRSHGELDGGVFLDLLVPLQIVDGVIGGADESDVGLLNQAADGQLGVVLQFVVAQVPDFLSGVAVQDALIAEEVVQLQVGPVVHRVADGHGQSLCELLEALAIGLVPGDVLFRHTVGAHHAPLVVVAEVAAVRVAAAQPDLSDVVEAAVLVDLAGRDVAVIVADGHILCIVVIQMLSRGRLEHEFLIHKCFHGSNSFSDSFIG